MFTWLLTALLAAANGAEPARVAGDPVETIRHAAVADPAGAIMRGRALLDGAHLPPEQEREVLRWMGRAALLGSNDAALSEVAIRLDGLAAVNRDDVAAAYAGFLRSERLFQRGNLDAGLKTAFEAAQRLQDRREPALRGLVAYQLCDALSSAEQYARAQTYCEEAEATFRALRDERQVAHAENVHSYVLYNQGDLAEAVRLSESARGRFLALGEIDVAALVGDNLARMYIEQGHAEQALALSEAALATERRAGRQAHALLSIANIARAYGALGRHKEALGRIEEAIVEARSLKLDGVLPDLYDTQSHLAEAAGQLKLALAAARASQTAQDQAHRVESDATAELEARYAAREKDLRINELERENRVKQLEIEASQARESARQAGASRERWVQIGSAVLAIGLAVSVVLLLLLLRAQRGHARHLAQLAHSDPLTGCGNRRAFFARIEKALLTDHSQPQALMLIDLDHFKRINDSFGHPFGDAVLREIAELIARTLDGRGFLARLGGEEFAVYSPGLEPTEALRLAEAIRLAVAERTIQGENGPVHVSMSIGLAMLDHDRFPTADAWLRQADRALYVAKSRGRNRVVASTAVK